MPKLCRSIGILTVTITCTIISSSAHAVTVFKDDFNRLNSSTLGAISGPGTGIWNELISPPPVLQTPGDVDIFDGVMRVDHGASDAVYEVFIPTVGFLAPWSSTLGGNPGKVTWNINMQSGRPDLTGPGPITDGIGVVLVSTGSGFDSGVTGYLLSWGEAGNDPLRLFRVGTGVTLILTASTAPFNNIGTNYLSIRVEYEPSTHVWTLFARDDGPNSFSDPSQGTFVNLGSNVDGVLANVTMTHVGVFGSYTQNGPNDIYRYDNFSISVAPEPSAMRLAFVGFTIVIASRRRRDC